MQYIGKNIIQYPQLGSTNNKAKELIKTRMLAEGSLIIAHEQLAGRGYAKNSWESAPGLNLTASYILRPDFLIAHRQFRLTKVLSLAVRDTVAGFYNDSFPIAIKWPNDIYVGDQKIAGILVENNIMADEIKECIAGIGLNINQETFVSDAPNPISLKNLTGKTFSIGQVCEVLSLNIQKWYDLLRQQETGQMDAAYQNQLYRLNTLAEFRANHQILHGYIRGTNEYGFLVLETREGEFLHFDFKEISFVI